MTYPQLSSGAVSQFPVRKLRYSRTVVNRTADGRVIKRPDTTAQITEWQLQYSLLSDAELATLQQFFNSMSGSLNGFTFLDPCGNLLAWSDELSQTTWQKDPLITLTGGVADPAGGQNGWTLVNTGTGPQGVSQVLNSPGGYVYCLSVYAQATQPTSAVLSIAGQSSTVAVETGWNRVAITGTGSPSATSVAIGFQLAAGASMTLYGPQLEPQASPSAYQSSTTGGVYQNARFRDDTFTFSSTDVNRNFATVNILYVNHL